MRIPFGTLKAKTGLAILFAAGAAVSAINPAAEVIRVWNNGGSVSIDIYQSTDGRNFSFLYGAGNKLGGATALKFLAGDFSGDGRTDVIQVWNNTGSVSIEGYRWDTVTKRFERAVGGGRRFGGSTALAFLGGDINGDGRADVIEVWNNGGYVSIEGYTFSATENNFQYTVGGGTKLRQADNSEFLAGDVNGDGRTDVVHIRKDASVSGYNKSVAIYFSNGRGFEQSPNLRYINDYDGMFNFRLMGDLTKDGKSDLLHVTQSNDGYSSYISSPSSMGYYLAAGNQAFFTVQTVYLSYSYEYMLADADGDGDNDLIGVDFYWSNHNKFALNLYPNYLNETGSTSYWLSQTQSPPAHLAVLAGNVE